MQILLFRCRISCGLLKICFDFFIWGKVVHISQPREICCSQFSPSAIWAWDWILATRRGWPQVPFYPQTITASVSLLTQTLPVWRNHFPVCFPKRFRFKEVFVAIGFECANYVVQWFFEKRRWSLGKSQNFEIHQHLMILPRTEWGGKCTAPVDGCYLFL